jgi:penicillin-binding protein 1C
MSISSRISQPKSKKSNRSWRDKFLYHLSKIYTYRHRLIHVAVGVILILLSQWRFNWFDTPYSTIVVGDNYELLGATIANDGQWRFPMRDSIDAKYALCLMAYEDQNFLGHNGIYLPAMARALQQNVEQSRIVSGGSTLTMQVARIARHNPARTWWEKIIETAIAWQIEQSYSKQEILSMYASHAPFGGNVVGIEAAAWRYYGRSPSQLSWSESATLAALPNAPSLIYPGKSQQALLDKRNFILQKLVTKGILSPQEFELASMEQLPQKPNPLPQFAPHLLHYLKAQFPDQNRFKTTVDPELQKNGARVLEQHMAVHQANRIANCAALIVEVETGRVLMYHGNTPNLGNQHEGMVDVIHAPRSTGSILKPVLYCAMLQEGLLLPETLIEDVPIQFDGFTPKNYFDTYDGMVPASNALSRSLNIPAVVMLKDYGYPRFTHLLQKLNLSDINQPADHYGLSLILGGAESNLWDLTQLYAGMSRTLLTNELHVHQDLKENYNMLTVVPTTHSETYTSYPPLEASAIWCTFQALMKVNRPDSELGWQAYDSARPIAWKTGTSFGNRDGWAIGTTQDYVISVWTGNADGTGRPGLTGIQTAAPILFDLFKLVQPKRTFAVPTEELSLIETCAESGMRKGPHCMPGHWTWAPTAGLRTNICSYHQPIFVDPVTGLQVTGKCFATHQMEQRTQFVLSPVHANYYKNKHPEYTTAPPFLPGCEADNQPVGIMYPRAYAHIYITKGLDGVSVPIVLEAAHHRADQQLYWHLDDQYLGETNTIHQMEATPAPGSHRLVVVDQLGHSAEVTFYVMEKEN